jgi:4-amino-4-deoxy-L-arabinose transferase-like glycosyltransferase
MNREISRWWARARISFFWMVLIALALRVGYIAAGHTYRFKTQDDNFGFAFEMGRIGRSLVEGEGFANPFSGTTGPTAWEPPVYPFLIAAVFKIFGVYSHTSAFVLLAINSLFSALTCIPIFLIAQRSFGEKVAVWSAWAWALLPNIIFWCTRWVWETSLATLLLAWIFWLTLTFEEKDGLRAWIQFGCIWGLTSLVNTSLLSFLPASLLWMWHRALKRGKFPLAGVALAGAVFAACIAPWLVRNELTFAQFVFIRSNFGAELRLGNGPGADGTWMDYSHPTKNLRQLIRYKQLGEIAYVAERKREALEYIRDDYGRFVRLCLNRFIYYWGGLPSTTGSEVTGVLKNSIYLASSLLAFWGLGRALRRHRPGAWLFLWLILCYPLVYYITFPHPRYRHPIEPELGILMIYVISEAKPRR